MISLFQLPCGLAATLLAASCLKAGRVVAGPSVNVATKAAFPAPPYLLELLETAAGENATSYFPLLDRIADGAFAGTKTDKDLYDEFLKVLSEDGYLSSPEALSTFKLALSMRTVAPRIEAHYQYYTTAVASSLGGARKDCPEWILLNENQYCSAALVQSEGHIAGHLQLQSLPFDHSLGSGHAAILYADITKPGFGSFHRTLSDLARKGEISYRLRYRTDERPNPEPLAVSGYGVELQLKRTDYIVIDDREAEEAHATKPQKIISNDLDLDQEEDVADLKPLSASELASLGLKAASFIMQSEDPLHTLIKLTQDFPKYSTSIASHDVSAEFDREYRKRSRMVPAGMNVLWMNGVQLTERQIEPYSLIDGIRQERNFIRGVTDLGLTGKEAVSVMGFHEVAVAKANEEPRRFDWRDEIEDGRVIIWINNIEKDKRYANYPSSLVALMQRTMPGQIPPVRKDVFNVVLPVDFTKPEDLFLVVVQIQNFIKRLPVRFGIVPLTPNQKAEDRTKAAYHILENYGLASFMSYLGSFDPDHREARSEEASFDHAVKDKSPKAEATPLSYQEILVSEYHERQLELAKHWVTRLNADTTIPPIFANGLPLPREKNWLQAMTMRIAGDLQMIQQAIFMGSVDEDTWIPSIFVDDALKHRNVYIFPDQDNLLTVLDVSKIYIEHHGLFSRIPVIEANEDSSRETWATLTLIVDLSSPLGLRLLLSSLSFRRNNPGVRLDIIHNPSNSEEAHALNARLLKSVDQLVEVENLETLEVLMSDSGAVEDNGFSAALSRFTDTARITPGDQVLMLNGRVVGPITDKAPFGEEAFQQLLDFEQSTRILPVYKAIEALDLTTKVLNPLSAAKLTSLTALSTISDLPEGIFESAPTLRSTLYDDWNSVDSAIRVGDESTANIHLVAVLNPASEQGQKWAPILKVLSELDGVFLRIFLNPKEKLEELPVKRFYRYLLDSQPSFDEAGKVRSQTATFKGLPSEALLNLGLDVPPAWLVAAKESVHDLDNVKLSSIKSDVDATYELEHILIEGHSRDAKGSPPRGVQLVLQTQQDPHFSDTIIMANLGYFQFKANPGYYNITLEKGRSSEIFDIISVGAKGYEAVPGDEGTEVALMDFRGATLYPRLRRRPGTEFEDVLDDGNGDSGDDLLSRGLKFAEGFLGGSKPKTKSISDEVHADINIFSVASGHLYERMLNIMMVSVMKNTKHTVKFWFIEQFLSPSFKEFIPQLAEEYGFKYEMVTYKWPHWLRQQKEKQREIWGYKILFLDVLFPLSLDKVIFVDADQIVRTDMIDLVNHDLQDAPYGFTPMCDSRTEMEGFRFWKQGYWENYLEGAPYHISALYVIDLRRFRQIAAGDRLRQHYHQLSADPNSLSNLDQDLPNHMQFVIPIHSLPQDWLWCETWCSDESQKNARTIDLCNNPQTKEPKLDRARRQVPEWTVYDDEIAALHRRRKGSASVEEDQVATADGVEPNTKSRRFEEEPETKTRAIDEL